MRPDLLAIAARQGGLVTRDQARSVGYRPPELRGLTSPAGRWVVVRRGVYAEREQWDAADTLARWEMRDRAASLTTTVGHELSFDSAARCHRLPLVMVKRDLSHVTRPDVLGSRTEHGIKHHRGPSRSPGLPWVDGLPVTPLARTAVDLAREHGLPTGLAACDAVLRSGVPRAAFWAELATMSHWPGVVAARSAAELADPRAESAGESLARLLVVELGLGDVEPQFAVRLAGRTVWVDLRVGCHGFEFDGRLKYRSRADGGLAQRPAEEIVWDERQREREICAIGLGMSRLSWDDLFGAARVRARHRLLAEYAVTAARFGTRLPEHLEAFSRAHSFDRVPPVRRVS